MLCGHVQLQYNTSSRPKVILFLTSSTYKHPIAQTLDWIYSPQPSPTLVAPSTFSLPLPHPLTLQKGLYVCTGYDVDYIIENVEELTDGCHLTLDSLKRLRHALTNIRDQYHEDLLTSAPSPILW